MVYQLESSNVSKMNLFYMSLYAFAAVSSISITANVMNRVNINDKVLDLIRLNISKDLF